MKPVPVQALQFTVLPAQEGGVLPTLTVRNLSLDNKLGHMLQTIMIY